MAIKLRYKYHNFCWIVSPSKRKNKDINHDGVFILTIALEMAVQAHLKTSFVLFVLLQEFFKTTKNNNSGNNTKFNTV